MLDGLLTLMKDRSLIMVQLEWIVSPAQYSEMLFVFVICAHPLIWLYCIKVVRIHCISPAVGY